MSRGPTPNSGLGWFAFGVANLHLGTRFFTLHGLSRIVAERSGVGLVGGGRHTRIQIGVLLGVGDTSLLQGGSGYRGGSVV